jgi:quercetin dioxygenase-like cupin family protein
MPAVTPAANPAARTLDVMGTRTELLLTAEETGGAATVVRIGVPPGWENPPHIHWYEDESFYVLAGEIEVTVGGRVSRLVAGQAALGPKRVAHAFRNPTGAWAEVLVTATPGGLDRFFQAVHDATPRGGQIETATLLDLIARHGMSVA